MGAWDDVDRDQFADTSGGFTAGLGCGLDGIDAAANDDGAVAAADEFLADEFDVRGFDHDVRRFERPDEAFGFDEAQCVAFDDGDDLSPRRSGWGVGAWGWIARMRSMVIRFEVRIGGRDRSKVRDCASQPVRSEMMDNWARPDMGGEGAGIEGGGYGLRCALAPCACHIFIPSVLFQKEEETQTLRTEEGLSLRSTPVYWHPHTLHHF